MYIISITQAHNVSKHARAKKEHLRTYRFEVSNLARFRDTQFFLL
jgi:hypothetical protein